MENRSIVGLDLVRFGAALSVVWFHLAFWNWYRWIEEPFSIVSRSTPSPHLGGTAWAGWVGVEVFFVISGFVIAMSAEHKSALPFLKGRFLRLYPAVWITAPFSALIIAAMTLQPDAQILKLLVRSLVLHPNAPWISGVYWTLGVEMFFYFLIFVLLLTIGFEYFEEFIITISLISVAFLLTAHLPFDPFEFFRYRRLERLLLLRHGVDFGVGGMFWLCARHGINLRRLLLLALFCFAACVEIHMVGVKRAVGAVDASPYTPVLIWLAALALMAAFIRWNHHMLALPPRFLSFARYVGLATFPLYLMHDTWGKAVIRIGSQTGVTPRPVLAVAILVVCVVCAGFLRAEQWMRPHLAALLHAVIPDRIGPGRSSLTG